MAQGPFKPGFDDQIESTADELDDQAVENFSFDVSPNIRADHQDAVQPSLSAAELRRRSTREPTRRAAENKAPAALRTDNPAPETADPDESAALQDVVDRSHTTLAGSNKKSPKAKVNQRTPIAKALKKQEVKKETSLWRRRPAWVLSLGLHGLIILAMSLLGFAVAEPDNFLLWASAPPSEPIEEFQDVEFESPLDLEEFETELPTHLEDPGMASLGEVSAESVFRDLSETGLISGDSIGNWGSMFGDQGNGLSDLGLGQGNALTSFFGTKSDARRVVFVIDNTGSMRSGGLETVIVEMMKTVDQLDKRQEFYVLFFSDQVYPLFFPQSSGGFVHPTDENKRKLRQWLDSVEFCTGGVWQLTQALEAAYKLRPEVVYLLTDGRHWDMVRADYKVEAVKNLRSVANPSGIQVHTLGMGCKTDFDRENLARVAEANGGTFREVKVGPAMVEIAYSKNRPYHIDGPGAIWGTMVRKRNSPPKMPTPQPN